MTAKGKNSTETTKVEENTETTKVEESKSGAGTSEKTVEKTEEKWVTTNDGVRVGKL